MTKFIFIMTLNLMLSMSILGMIISSISLNNKFIHPTSLGSILILFSMLLSINLSIYFNNHWFSFIMFLTIISGMMILFMYFISFINNMKMSIKMNSLINLILINLILIIMFLIFYYKMNNILWFKFNETMNIMNLNKLNLINNFMKINFMYLYNKNFSTIISMLYLFFCLTLIVKMCMMNKYSIRKIN